MQIFTKYNGNTVTDQQFVFSAKVEPCPPGWTETTLQPDIKVVEKTEVPDSVTNFQARAVLMQMPSSTGVAGRTVFDDVNDTLKAQGGIPYQAWEQANDFTRDGTLVNSFGAKLGLSSDQLDQVFITASTIEA